MEKSRNSATFTAPAEFNIPTSTGSTVEKLKCTPMYCTPDACEISRPGTLRAHTKLNWCTPQASPRTNRSPFYSCLQLIQIRLQVNCENWNEINAHHLLIDWPFLPRFFFVPLSAFNNRILDSLQNIKTCCETIWRFSLSVVYCLHANCQLKCQTRSALHDWNVKPNKYHQQIN